MKKTDLLVLDRNWVLLHDPDDLGRKNGYGAGLPEDQTVPVARFPGWVHLTMPKAFGIAWYQTRFTGAPGCGENQRYLLRFAGAGYLTEVYLNGAHIGNHRGIEDPFEFDVTGILNTTGENLLCVRMSKPHAVDVDGYTFAEIPHCNERTDHIFPGVSFNCFGIWRPVDIIAVPAVRIDDLFVNGNVETGEINVQITVNNLSGAACTLPLCASAAVKRSGELQARVEMTLDLPAGESVHTLSVPISQVRLWDIKDPFLYLLTVALGEGDYAHVLHKTCGFRTFIVGQDGYFYLNGQRIFVKCTHSGNCHPAGQRQDTNPELWRQDMVKAKACGMNMVRIISGVALTEQLDYCDELGLMLYEEPMAGWLTENGPRTKELYMEDLLTMVKRDRSHPSLCIIGLLNETGFEKRFQDCMHIAREALGEVRKLDNTRLVLYSSGRWDCDATVGSVSNPGSDVWECLWNEEDPVTGPPSQDRTGLPAGFVAHVGDVHAYPRVPLSDKDVALLRTLGQKPQRPVFVSEFGIGNILNTRHALLRCKMLGLADDMPDIAMMRSMDDLLMKDLKQYGLDDIYPFPISLLRESERLQARHRTVCFDIIRSNPMACGISMTGMLDHSICGEGLWTMTREFKPGGADALEGGCSPLRWCLFVHRTHSYVGRPFTIEGVLANEDVLKAGTYPIGVKIFGEQGTVWEKFFDLTVTEEMLQGMSVPAFKETITLDVPEGEYRLCAEVLEGATAADSSMAFFLSDDRRTQAEFDTVYGAGLDETMVNFLTGKGVRVLPLEQADGRCLILVGDIAKEDRETVWHTVYQKVGAGARALAACRYALIKDEEYCHYLQVPEKPDCYPHMRGSNDWLYHKEYIAKRHPYFDGLPNRQIMNWEYYMQLIGGAAFRGGTMPGDIAAACVGPGIAKLDGYDGGFNIGTYEIGQGAITVSSFEIVEWIGQNPAADRLLCNILNEESRKLSF